jgi:hypothetical protein
MATVCVSGTLDDKLAAAAAAGIVRRAGHPALGLCLDSFAVLGLDPRSIGPEVLTVALATGRALPSLDDDRRLQT